MALVAYIGDHAGVVVPVTESHSIEAEWGVAVDVPDHIAESLLTSAAWKPAKEGKKAADKAAPTIEKHVDETVDEKE